MTTTTTLTGTAAIEYAARRGLTLNKHADPTEGARTGLTISEARQIAKEDPSLVWVETARTVRVDARRFEDHDDSLAAATEEYIEEHPDLAGWDLDPRWESEERDAILLAVPAWAAEVAS